MPLYRLSEQRLAADAGGIALGRGRTLVTDELDHVVVGRDERLDLSLRVAGIRGDVDTYRGTRVLLEHRQRDAG
jgi:hypothetical protein